jgi:hypothetical protein
MQAGRPGLSRATFFHLVALRVLSPAAAPFGFVPTPASPLCRVGVAPLTRACHRWGRSVGCCGLCVGVALGRSGWRGVMSVARCLCACDLADQAVQAGGPGLSRAAFISGALWELSVAPCRGNASLCWSGAYVATRAADRSPMCGLAQSLTEVV